MIILKQVSQELNEVAGKFQKGSIGLRDTLRTCKELGLKRHETKQFIYDTAESKYYRLISIPNIGNRGASVDSTMTKLYEGTICVEIAIWYLRIQGLSGPEIIDRVYIMVDNHYNRWRR